MAWGVRYRYSRPVPMLCKIVREFHHVEVLILVQGCIHTVAPYENIFAKVLLISHS